jgi:phenylalanyl-tRNA synthetase beta chain
MRRWILPSLIRRVEHNMAHGNRDVRLFEIGTSFRKAGPGEPPHEETHLCAILTGHREPPHWSRPADAFEVWDVKALFEDVLRRAWSGTVPIHASATDLDRLDAETSFEAVLEGGVVVGRAGRVADHALDLPPWAGDVWAMEVTLPAEPAPRAPVTYRPLPQYPASERDLALLVPEGVAAGAVTEAIRAAGGAELESVELFDVYTGQGLAEGTRSVAYRLRFRAPERTLKDKEVDRSVGTVLKRLEEDLGVKARG